jgi:hyperosmotically inducible protein
MKTLLVLILGVAIGFGVYWFVHQPEGKEHLQKAEEKLSSGANQVKEKINEKVGDLKAEDIKEELARTGKVVRKKAKELGAAVADATADARITAAIKAKYAVDPDLSAWSISVNTTDGKVTLAGTVSSYERIEKAINIALETEGVREVVSTLQVKP